MLFTEEKVIAHFFTNGICVYRLKNTSLEPIKRECVAFEESFVSESLLNKIDCFLEHMEEYAGTINNEHIRLYATGIFQEFNQPD